MMLLIRWTITVVILAVLLWVAVALLIIRPNLTRIEKDYSSVAIGASYADVRSSLSPLREIRVERMDVPKGYRDTIDPLKELHIYRYERFCALFSFHVVYDADNKVLMKLPTYE